MSSANLHDKIKATVARLPWRVTLLIVSGALLLAAALWFGLDSLVTASLSAKWQLAAFACIAIILLTIGLGGLAFTFRQQRNLPISAIIPGLIVVLAVLPSFIIAITFAVVAHTVIRPTQSLLAELLMQPEASLWRPWVFLWQMLVLAFALWITVPSSQISINEDRQKTLLGKVTAWLKRNLPNKRSFIASLLGGLALWLVFTFIQSIAASFSQPWLDLSGGSETPIPLGLSIVLAFLALAIAPWLEETFFRGFLMDHWQSHLTPLLANACVAAVFAFLPMRPLLWLPAFLLGFGLGILRQRSGLPAAIFAHILFNALMLLLNPLLVI
jgi:membrane protease YdiL (CAAX protease family)